LNDNPTHSRTTISPVQIQQDSAHRQKNASIPATNLSAWQHLESKLAHSLLDGLRGIEIGPSTHNPFGLNTRNVGHHDPVYEQEQKA
jgi:hypothetical protein